MFLSLIQSIFVWFSIFFFFCKLIGLVSNVGFVVAHPAHTATLPLYGINITGAATELSEDGYLSVQKFQRTDKVHNQNTQTLGKFKGIGCLYQKVFLRMGAWHLLLHFSGCLGTRGTLTATAPEQLKNISCILLQNIWNQFYNQQFFLKIIFKTLTFND